MEERTSLSNSSISDDNEPPPLPPPPSDTYIIQIPKDQIYRVPPPENARIIERYFNPPNINKNSLGASRMCCVLLALVTSVLVLSVLLGATYAIFNPQNPEFSVQKLVALNGTTSHSRREFEMLIEARNPNRMLGVYFESPGKVKLVLNGKEAANGKFPGFRSDAMVSMVFRVVVNGRDDKTVMRHDKAEARMILEFPVWTVGLGFIKSSKMGLYADCSFKVKSLDRQHGSVSSQDCRMAVK